MHSFLNSVLQGGVGQLHDPAALATGKLFRCRKQKKLRLFKIKALRSMLGRTCSTNKKRVYTFDKEILREDVKWKALCR
jgi:hypothetical protein